MTDTSGFFRVGPCGTFMRAGKFVFGPGYELHWDQKDTYAYPAEGGWVWLDDVDQARAHFNLPPDAPCLE